MERRSGYALGRPAPAVFRRVDPPQRVLVDLSTLFPRAPHSAGRGRYHPGGLQLHAVVVGRLTCWGRCEWGQWWGLVTYSIVFGPQARPVTHWIPAWVLKPDVPATPGAGDRVQGRADSR
jgi:hypothetical protein